MTKILQDIASARAALLAMPVPRYTSYPTANHFCETIDQSDWLGAMSRLPEAAPLSLYLHIPYCETICTYCGCTTKLLTRAERLERYVERLLVEIERKSALLNAGYSHKRPVSHIHFGGGTPNLLTQAQLERILSCLSHAFDIRPDAEIAMEFDPRVMTREQVFAFTSLGVNRASLGVQSFAPEVQQAINRVQPISKVQKAVDDLRDAGIGGINFDLVYGLPLQTLDDVIEDCRLTAQMGADRVAIFGYAHVPHVRPAQRKLDGLHRAEPKMREAMALAAHQALSDARYAALGIDHFARPEDSLAIATSQGLLRRNFQGYTADGAVALVGFGVSAISTAPGLFCQNPVRQKMWEDMIDEDGPFRFPRGLSIAAEDQCRAAIIEAIMCNRPINPAMAATRFGLPANLFTPELEALEHDARLGLVDPLQLQQGVIMPGEGAHQFTRIIASRFDTWLNPEAGRHAQAV
ncbi:MAG: oxygen-independent coproporphyrinogen III oxidase [Alphaproteobacteria bacterium]